MQELQDDIYEGLSFEERIAVRRKLIAQYGTSIRNQEKESSIFEKEQENSNNNEILEIEDPRIYEGKSFEERIEIRNKLIEKYGTSLKRMNQDEEIFDKEKEKKSVDLADPKIFEGKKYQERLEIRKKLIEKYGTSLVEGKKEDIVKKTKKSNQGAKKADFDTRVQKRRIIARIEGNKSVDPIKKKIIVQNKIEFINDPDIIIDDDANICYVTDKKVKERVEFKKKPGIASEIMKGDSFNGSYEKALKRAKTLAGLKPFPSFYVPWSPSRGVFRTSYLDKVKEVRSLITNRDFYPVS